jgi:NADPH:quinone reductase-like Zn-dependent oxidoreductase
MAEHEARAFWIAAPGRGEIRHEQLAPALDDGVVVRALYSGISRGTESIVFQGRVPVGERERMRAPFQAGVFPAPVKYGYSSVGIVEEGPTRLMNRHVFTLYPHQTRYCVPAAAVHPLPPRVPPERAVLAANLETAINGLWDAPVLVGDRVVVVGAGAVGCLVGWLAGRVSGAEVTLVDVNPARAEVAAALGVAFAVPDFAPNEADLVVHASGSQSGLELALNLAGFEATVLEMSWYGDASVALPLGGAFHARRLTVRSSQVGHVAGAKRARWDTRRRMALALSLLDEPALDVLITGESAFDDLPAVLPQLVARGDGTLCHRIRYR